MRRIESTTASLLAALVLAATGALADGCLLAPWEYEIYETEQIAYLDYDAETGREDLHLLPKFYGDTQDFAWIVPVPGLPELETSDPDIFRQLSLLTAPEYRHRDEGWGCDRYDELPGPAGDQDNGVDIIDEQLVGIYRTMIVGADDAAALTDSLSTWGFIHADNADEVSPMLAAYVDDGWYFVTLKVDSTAFDEAQYDWYWYGAMHPIRLGFDADAPVYPMRISALSADYDTSVTLFVNADRRLDFVGAETLYANAFDAREKRAVDTGFEKLAPLIATGDYLTKLRRIYAPEQMIADVYLVPAGSNAEFHQVYYSGLPMTTGLLLGVVGLLLWRRRS